MPAIPNRREASRSPTGAHRASYKALFAAYDWSAATGHILRSVALGSAALALTWRAKGSKMQRGHRIHLSPKEVLETAPHMQFDEDAENMLQTEEELKSKVILPWLESVGLAAPPDLTAERVLSLHVGRHRIPLRYDYLVCSRNRPLFFLEAKPIGHTLNEEDREQVRTYARLHDPIAPLAMVTNGKDTQVYDVLTDRRIDGEVIEAGVPYFNDGFVLDPGTDLRLRTEAIAHFISLNPDNLRRFSGAQCRYRASHLIGDGANPRRIVRELYVASGAATADWRSFLSSSDPLFVLLGDAGIGKTNALWEFCESSGDGQLALFFDAGRLPDGLWAALCDDFNWGFSARQDKEQLVRNLRQIAAEANIQLLIFIDALDENPSDNFALEVDEFCRRNAEHGLRVILTCRKWDWQRFTHIRDDPTWTGECCRISMLPPFSNDEFTEAWAKYSSVFRLSGNPSPSLIEGCRDRFTLRALAEVYAGGQVPDRVDVPELVSRFVDGRLARTGDQRTLHACLVALARSLYETREQVISGDRLLALPAWSPQAMNQLLSAEILASVPEERYRFALGLVQNLFVSIKANRWNQTAVADFESISKTALFSAVGQQALAWFVSHHEAYQDVVRATIEGRALAYITRRKDLIARWVPGLRLALDPFAEVGASLHLVTRGNEFSGLWYLAPRSDPESPIVVIDEFERLPARCWQRTGVPDDVQVGSDLAEEIARLLGRDLLQSSRLRYNRPFLGSRSVVDELVFAEAAPWAEDLSLAGVHKEIGHLYSGSFTREELEHGIRTWSAYWYAHREVARRKEERGEAEVVVREGIRTVGLQFSNADREEMRSVADGILSSGKPVPLPTVTGGVPRVRLLVALLQQTDSTVFSSPLPAQDTAPEDGGLIEDCYSPELKRAFLQPFFETAVRTLRESTESLLGPVVRQHRPWLRGPLAVAWHVESSWSAPDGSVVTYVIGASEESGDMVVESSALPEAPWRQKNSQEDGGITSKPELWAETAFSSFLRSERRRSEGGRSAPTPLFDWTLRELRGMFPKDLFLDIFHKP